MYETSTAHATRLCARLEVGGFARAPDAGCGEMSDPSTPHAPRLCARLEVGGIHMRRRSVCLGLPIVSAFLVLATASASATGTSPPILYAAATGQLRAPTV